MAHNHQHTHQHSISSEQVINRSFIIGIVLNVVYVVVELIFGFAENSTSLLSDAVHNIGDISALLLAFLTFRLMKIKANKIFSYGFKKGSIVASFINSVLLAFAIGAIAWEGVDKIIDPNPINGFVVMLVASVGVIINFISAILFHKDKEHDLNLKAAYWHLMADALVSFGVVVSGVLMYFFHWYVLDGITALIIAVVVLISTWSLFKDSLIAVLDGVPQSINANEIKQHLLQIAGVKDVHHTHIWGISTHEIAMTAHILIEDLKDLPRIKNALKSELQGHQIKHSTLEFELYSEQCHDKNI